MLIIFHAVFRFRGIAGMAYWFVLAVAVSRIVGRYIYGQIAPRGNATALSLAESSLLEKRLSAEVAAHRLVLPADPANLFTAKYQENGPTLMALCPLLLYETQKNDHGYASIFLDNGFRAPFLMVHPIHAGALKFTLDEQEILKGGTLKKVTFRHNTGSRSPLPLALCGRECPLELGRAGWIDPATAASRNIDARIAGTLPVVALKTLDSKIDFAPLRLTGSKKDLVVSKTVCHHWHNLTTRNFL